MSSGVLLVLTGGVPWGGVVPVLLRRGGLDEAGHRVMVGETGLGNLRNDLSQAFHDVSGWMSRAGTLGCHRNGPSTGRGRSRGRNPADALGPVTTSIRTPRPLLGRKRRTRSDVSADSTTGLRDGCQLTCSKLRPLALRDKVQGVLRA